MYFELYEKLKLYAILYPDQIDVLTQEILDSTELEKTDLSIYKDAPEIVPFSKENSD